MKKLLYTAVLIITMGLTSNAQNDRFFNWNNNYYADDRLIGIEFNLPDAHGDINDHNGWSPSVQLINAEGEKQWGDAGIHITTPNLASWSPGYAMAALNDGVASMFRTEQNTIEAVGGAVIN